MNTNENRRKGFGIRKRTLVGVLAVLVACTLIASAGLLTYYGQISTTANVSQSVLLDGNDYNTPITHDIDANAGCCYCYEHTVENTACVEAPIDITTNINAYGKGPEGVSYAYYLDEWIDDDNVYNGGFMASGPTAYYDNTVDDSGYTVTCYLPYIDWVFNTDGTIDITFHNPTTWTVVFDYRVDEEPGEDHDLTDQTISQGPCAGETWGQKYNWVVISGVGEETVTVEPCYQVMVGSRLGGEQNAYVPWITIERPELTTPLTIQPGEQIDFLIQYCFDVAIIPGRYDITSQIIPTP